MSRPALWLFAALLGLASGPLAAADWPQFLGPNRDGTSPETGLIETIPTNGLPVVWQKNVGPGYGAPSVRDGKLVFHHRLDTNEVVACLDAKTGQPLWQFAYESRFQDPYGYNNGPRSTPLLTADRCFTFGAEGVLTCLDLKDGKKIWQRFTAREWEIPEAFFGVGSSPVLEDNVLLVMIGGQPNAGMIGLDPQTGRTLWESVGETNWTGVPMTGWPGERKVEWKRFEKQASYSTPVVATVNGRRTAFCLMRQGLVALDPKTGRVQDSFWFRARVDESVNAMDPVVSSNYVFISSAYYKVGSVLLRVRPDTQKFEEVWRGLAMEMHWPTPVLHEGFLYGLGGRNEPDARFRCVEFLTGRVAWERTEAWGAHSARQPEVYGRGSLTKADGKLFVLGEGGLLGLFRLDATKPVEISRWQVPALHHPTWAAPVLSGKKLYLRSEDRLICLDLARP